MDEKEKKRENGGGRMDGRRERKRDRGERDTLTFYCLQLTSPQDKGVRNMINFPSRTATCKNHAVLSKGISSMDNEHQSSASARCSALPAEIFTVNPSRMTERDTHRERQRQRKSEKEGGKRERGRGKQKHARYTTF